MSSASDEARSLLPGVYPSVGLLVDNNYFVLERFCNMEFEGGSMNIYESVARLSGENPPNQDPTSNIHYGVAHTHSLWNGGEDFYDHAEDLTYKAGVEEVRSEIRRAVAGFAGRKNRKGRMPKYARNALPGLFRKLFRDFCSDYTWHREVTPLAQAVADARTFVSEPYEKDEVDDIVDSIWGTVEQEWNDHYEADNPEMRYDSGSYVIETCLDTDLMVIKAPYWTLAPHCSPCCPNAGNLDSAERSPESGNLKTYCLDEEWFEERPSYPYWRVDDNTLVYKGTVRECPNCGLPMDRHEIEEPCPEA